MKLGELISRRQAELGLSLEKLAMRAREQGYELTKTTLSAFVNHDLNESPKRRTMQAIAVALDVGYADVVMAVAESMTGDASRVVEVTNEQRVRAWLTITEGRTDDEVAALLRVIRTVTATLDAAHDQESRAADGGVGTADGPRRRSNS